MSSWFHLMTDIEHRFKNLEQAEAFVKDLNDKKLKIEPTVPRTAMPDEDHTTPRICVAPSLEQCALAIGPTGVLRRCCNAHPDAFSYVTTGLEVYPVIILEFDTDDIVEPTSEQVPDVNLTDECWITKPLYPTQARLVWLDPWSLEFLDEDPDALDKFIPSRLSYDVTDAVQGRYNHPWLNGKGHILDSSEEEEPEFNKDGIPVC